MIARDAGSFPPAPHAIGVSIATRGDVMDFGSIDVAVIVALIVMAIFLGSVLWRLHSAADIISKGRRYR